MKRLFTLQVLTSFLLMLGIVAYTTHLVQQLAPGAVIDLGGRHETTLSPQLRTWLDDLETPLTATLFLSDPGHLPSHLKPVARGMTRLLQSMADAAPDRVRVRVIDPDLSGGAGAAYAARARVSPLRVRQVVDDRNSEANVWMSLVLSRPGRADILLQGIQPQHLPLLQQWLLAHLRQQQPRSPTFAVDAPEGYRQFAGYLAQHGAVYEINLDADGEIPPVDLLFWVQPHHVAATQVARLRRFLASGRSLVLAGSPYHIVYDDAAHFHGVGNGPAWPFLLRAFGLRPLPDLLMDRNTGPVPVDLAAGPGTDPATRLVDLRAPFHLRNLPAFRDFRPLLTQARGGLSFAGAGALEINLTRASEDGWQTYVTATTTQHAWVQNIPDTPTPIASLSAGLPVPKQNLMVLLTTANPWSGQVLVLAAPTPFSDASLQQPGFGHAVFIRDLVRNFANPEHLVRIDVDRHQSPPLAATTATERLFWRLLIVALLPLAWLIWSGYRRRGDISLTPALRRPDLRTLAVPLALLIIVLLTSHLSGLRLDLTADQRHTLTPIARQSLRSLPQLQAELVISPTSQLPPRLHHIGTRVIHAFATAGIPLTVTHVETGSTQQRRWAQIGIAPFDAARVSQDTSRVEQITAGLSLRAGQHHTTIPRLDNSTLAHLDFLLVAAIERLRQGHAPTLTVISDLPRLSPAEALEDYQKKSLSAPRGTDVYSRAKHLLQDYGYDVHHVSLRDPRFPDHSDAMLWFQPRRDATPITQAFSRHLAAGGPAVVALQHYNIQQRQYRGAGFSTVHWPQPQFQDLQAYLTLIGIEQPREVLMDRSRYALRLATQVNRSAVREYDAQQVALPFLLRTVTAQHAKDDALSRNLGDLLFIWGNRFRLLPEAAATGLRVDTLVTTSDHAWAFDWRGGWLPPEIFTPETYLAGPQPLVLRLRGHFPAVVTVRDSSGGRHLEPEPAPDQEAQLLLIGSSEMFKDDYLSLAAFAHDQLLLNAVADAVFDDDMLSLQARGGGRRGFISPGEGERIAWRVAIIGLGPACFGLLGLLRQIRRQTRDPGQRRRRS